MNIYGVIHRYLRLKAMSPAERKKQVPHVAIFAGKAAPGYYVAKVSILNTAHMTTQTDIAESVVPCSAAHHPTDLGRAEGRQR